MSRPGDLTPAQRALLDRLDASELASSFYLTGGVALSAFHLHHRDSLDLDLFSRLPFDPKRVVRWLNEVAAGAVVPHRTGDRYEFTVLIESERVRVEFVHYDFDRIETTGTHHGRIAVDGLRDIAANKLSAVIERLEPKDFADLLFLLRRDDVPLARVIDDCRRKFGWPALEHILQTALLKVERLPGWPRTEPETTLEEARSFFREIVRTLIRVDQD
ncbi:MAG: nucleotidyl transferase AbiEii/AbiGii toxin family protein [Deltaproteobacteria bacterium]|nr:nucleotidyl transferase AbiEii/AbiGii toxin family protein [Deltaproteobacteria bacterium]